MTAIITFLSFFLMLAHFHTLGHILVDDVTIWRAGFLAVTASSAIALAVSGGRSNFAYACCIGLYCIFAPYAYNLQYPLLSSAMIDLAMAGAFALGARKWHIYAAGFYLAAFAVSVLSFLGVVPSHLERPYTFVAFSQPDLTAILGYCAMIACGLSAGDGGVRIRDWFGRPSVAAGHLHSVVYRVRAFAET